MRIFKQMNNAMYSNSYRSDEELKQEYNDVVRDNRLSKPPGIRSDDIICISNGKQSYGYCKNDMCKGTIITGETGAGKTTAFKQIASKKMLSDTEPTVNLFFDSKGDMVESFYKEGDVVLDYYNNTNITSRQKWNIIRELCFDDTFLADDAREIAGDLTSDSKDTNNEFFNKACKLILSKCMQILALDYEKKGIKPSNKDLFELLKTNPNYILNRAKEYNLDRDIANLLCVGGKVTSNGQTAGVMGELLEFVDEYIVANDKGSFSIRETLRNNKSINVFLEFDVNHCNVLSPMFCSIITLAIKECMGRNKGARLNLFIDEFSQLKQRLDQVINAASFGRTTGIYMMIATQYVGQIQEIYGENITSGVLSNFKNVIAFKSENYETRKYIKERFGEDYISSIKYVGLGQCLTSYNKDFIISDEDILSLDVGEAIVKVATNDAIFKFKFPNE